MDSVVLDRETDRLWNGNGKECEREWETGCEVGELANDAVVDVDIVWDSSVLSDPALVVGWMGCIELALGEDEVGAFAPFILVC